MANHQEKYDYYEILVHNEHQQITHGIHKEQTLQKVSINKIRKSSYVLPVDVSGFVNGFTQLVMLEEDPSHWYIITRKLDGTALFNAEEHESPVSMSFTHIDQLKEFLDCLKAYDLLAPFYQFHLLRESNWLVKDAHVLSKELLIFDETLDGFIDFPLVRAQANAMILKLFAGLNYLDQEPLSIEKITQDTQFISGLDALAEYWLALIDLYSNMPKPVRLEGLYTIPSETANAPMAKRRVLESSKLATETLSDSTPKANKPVIKPAIALTLITAVICLIILLVPALKLMLSPQPDKNLVDTSQSNTQNETLPPVESHSLSLDQIQLEGNGWSIDESIFYTGKESIRLDLTKTSPSGKMIIDPISLNKNSTVSLWLRSSKAGTVRMTVVLYNHESQISKSETTVPLEADQTWYLVSLLGSNIPQNIEDVNRLEITWDGSPQTLWIDDLTVESFK